LPTNIFLSEWIVRPRSNKIDSLPLKNAITPTTNTKDVRGINGLMAQSVVCYVPEMIYNIPER